MLTPRENLDVDSEDSEPAPHRNSGFRVVAEDGLQLSQFHAKVRFTTCRDTRFGRTLWNEEISLGR